MSSGKSDRSRPSGHSSQSRLSSQTSLTSLTSLTGHTSPTSQSGASEVSQFHEVDTEISSAADSEEGPNGLHEGDPYSITRFVTDDDGPWVPLGVGPSENVEVDPQRS
ncbi:MAG: hypothetical protein M1816_004509 [Peltula sp. TS41687]|nr:MAG: hypothetical protein M1816_004509 [Peltula sp. TS41687]